MQFFFFFKKKIYILIQDNVLFYNKIIYLIKPKMNDFVTTNQQCFNLNGKFPV